MADDNCVFCRIVKGDSPATVEKETDDVIAIRSIRPAAQTHILVIPKSHIKSFMGLDGKNKLIEKMRQVVQDVIRDKELSNAYKLMFNGGEYQVVPHVHWHILGGKLRDDYEERI